MRTLTWTAALLGGLCVAAVSSAGEDLPVRTADLQTAASNIDSTPVQNVQWRRYGWYGPYGRGFSVTVGRYPYYGYYPYYSYYPYRYYPYYSYYRPYSAYYYPRYYYPYYGRGWHGGVYIRF